MPKPKIFDDNYIRIQIKGKDKFKVEEVQSLIIRLFHDKVFTVSNVVEDKFNKEFYLAYVYIKT